MDNKKTINAPYIPDEQDMGRKTIVSVPYFLHEQAMARMERINKRLFIFCIVILIALIGTNAYWIYYENSFEDVVTTVKQDTPNGNNNFIGHDGDITNGITADSN